METTLPDIGPVTLEQRLTTLEAELQKANERVRALSESQRTSARARLRAAFGFTLLLGVLAWVAPTPAAPTTFTVPFTVKSARSNARMVVDDSKQGLSLVFYNTDSGGLVLGLGLTPEGTGHIVSQSPDGSVSISMGLTTVGRPALTLRDGGKVVGNFGSTEGRNGLLQIADKNEVIRVSAGTLENDDGAVRVFGPTGNCGVALAGISCMIVAR